MYRSLDDVIDDRLGTFGVSFGVISWKLFGL
jgi:hypothetical protein